MMGKRIPVQRGRGSGKTFALMMICIGTALRDAWQWVDFNDHEPPPKGYGHKFALNNADRLRGCIRQCGVMCMKVRCSANQVQVRFELPRPMNAQELTRAGYVPPTVDKPPPLYMEAPQ